MQQTQQRRVVLIMVEGDSPAESAAVIRSVADRIEKGDTFEAADAFDAVAVRPCAGEWRGEVPFVGRYYGVGYDGEGIDPPVALFASRGDAEAYANGGIWKDEEARPSIDGIVARCDAFGVMWNGDPDKDHVPDDKAATVKR